MKKNDLKKNKRIVCMSIILFSLSIYIHLKVISLSLFVNEKSYVSFPRPSSLWWLCYILLSMRDEYLLLGTLGHYSLHHLIHWWCGFFPCFDLSLSSFILYICIFIHPQVHDSWDFLYIYIFIHKGIGLDHRVFDLNFPSFLLPYHPSLHFVLCLKPWDQISYLIVSTWAGV